MDSQNWPFLDVAVDEDTGGLVVIDAAHYMIHAGQMFAYQEPATLAAAGVKNFVFTTAATKECHFQVFVDSLLELTVDVYKASTRVGTNLRTAYNKNQRSTITPTATVHEAIGGGGADGTLLYSYKNGDPATSRIQGIGISTGDRDEWILAASTKYLVRLTSGADGNNTNTMFRWYEV